MAHGLDGNGRILKMRQPFLNRLEVCVSERHLKPIVPFVYSIDHKLNVARYSAGLVRDVKPQDYYTHYYTHYSNKDHTPSNKSCTEVKYSERCTYYAYDWDQYSLGLLFFVESFSAAAFSLFDVSGHLLREMYNLPLEPNKASFHNASTAMKDIAPKMYSFLARFRTEESSCEDWFKWLKALRNCTTHSDITKIIKLETPYPPHPQEIRLRKDATEAPGDLILDEFVERCFTGLEDYVDGLYDRLARQVDAEKSLPLTGRFD